MIAYDRFYVKTPGVAPSGDPNLAQRKVPQRLKCFHQAQWHALRDDTPRPSPAEPPRSNEQKLYRRFAGTTNKRTRPLTFRGVAKLWVAPSACDKRNLVEASAFLRGYRAPKSSH